MKEKVNEQIDKYYSMYSLFMEREVCMKDFENYIIDVESINIIYFTES